MLIYIVEDDDNIRELEAFAMKNSGYDTRCFAGSKEFCQTIAKAVPDLILLDIMLPGDDGLTILKKLRDDPVTENIPVIIISAKTTELDRVKGLDLGADDYLCKPFGVMELVSRVKARLRGKSRNNEYRYAEILLNEESRKVFISGRQTELTYKEFELLKTLIKSPGKAFARDYLIDTIWGQGSTGRTLDVHIRTLRAKLGEYGRYIKTVRNVGYKLDKDE
ncbi:response regulator transcription factor [uncultured Ruminococcus sp.]|uniref:response regulator transcription factor n=1 Tax=uncultured Ruminococcus sp. TaxID=165186 RepID=UPI000ED182A1|nr:response regulator transcription factor [uncultured Ruminococcus sp.]HCJ41057.1 DNA-binding response regulator [Ruminococcus sp.]